MDHQRQPVFTERGVEDRGHVQRVGFRRDLAAQQITAMRVGEGEWIAAGAVPGAEPALEISTPGPIDALDGSERLRIRRRAHTRFAAVRETGALQHFAQGAFRRPDQVRMRGGEFHAQLARPPVPALARRQDVRKDLITELARRVVWRPPAVGECSDTPGLVPLQPLVDGLARNRIDLGQRRNAFALVVIVNQLNPEVHGLALFPRHRFLACRRGAQNPQLQSTVTHVLG